MVYPDRTAVTAHLGVVEHLVQLVSLALSDLLECWESAATRVREDSRAAWVKTVVAALLVQMGWRGLSRMLAPGNLVLTSVLAPAMNLHG